MKKTKIFIVFVLTGLFAFTACKENGKSDNKVSNSEHPAKNYTEIGLKYAKSTQAELGKNLMGAIQDEGTLGALAFCNIEAYPLTDSMATVHNAEIRRVSDRPRNPDNKANEKQLAYIDHFKRKIASGEQYEPIVENEHGIISFHAPIVTKAMCLQCHGKPEEQIQPLTMLKLQDLYPEDKAIGYDVDQVRGIWSIHFDENR